MKVRLSMAFQDLRGKNGTVVIAKGRTGLVTRPRVRGRNPKTVAQQGVRKNLSRSAAAFKNFTGPQLAAWTAYAQSIVKEDPITGASFSPTPINAFVGLAAKFLQVTPTGTIPLTPPATAFEGDSITFTAIASAGQISITASAANATNVKTEILLQRLDSRNCVPQSGAYRTKQITGFLSGALTTMLSVTPGTYAVAYRFVNSATGQETGIVPLSTQSVALSIVRDGKKAA